MIYIYDIQYIQYIQYIYIYIYHIYHIIGTSWTWSVNRGDDVWKIDEMEEIDSWHGRLTGA